MSLENPGVSNYSRCAGCKYLKVRCPADCVLAPYFPSTSPERFHYVRKIFGAKNIKRMLQELPVQLREQAANSLYSEAQLRIQDPIYGSARIIYDLQHEIYRIQCELAKIRAQIAMISAQQRQLNQGQHGAPYVIAHDEDRFHLNQQHLEELLQGQNLPSVQQLKKDSVKSQHSR